MAAPFGPAATPVFPSEWFISGTEVNVVPSLILLLGIWRNGSEQGKSQMQNQTAGVMRWLTKALVENILGGK